MNRQSNVNLFLIIVVVIIISGLGLFILDSADYSKRFESEREVKYQFFGAGKNFTINFTVGDEDFSITHYHNYQTHWHYDVPTYENEYIVVYYNRWLGGGIDHIEVHLWTTKKSQPLNQ